jgi:hypothetical protein
LPEAAYEALREVAFDERRKIHDLLMEGVELALKKRGLAAVPNAIWFGAETSSLDAVSAALHGETAEVAAGRNGRNKPVFFRRIVKMDRHDQELLDKQMRRLSPPRNDGVIVVLLATIIFSWYDPRRGAV